MKASIVKLYRAVTPELVRDKLFEFRKRKRLKSLNLHSIKKEIIKYLESKPDINIEEEKVLSYLIDNELTTFPYIDMNQIFDVKIKKDKKANLYYGEYEGKKLYFKPQSTKETNREYLNGLLNEQLEHSPHRYLSDSFTIDENTILADVGAAEGNFALSVVEKVKKVYLFETDPEWIKALEKTFAPWRDKVQIINKFVSNENSANSITLDSYFEGMELPNFLKLDVEGFEDIVLEGAEKTLEAPYMQVAICTYHKQGDDCKYLKYFSDRGFKTEFSDRYMIFIEDINNISPPFLRKGLLRASKP